MTHQLPAPPTELEQQLAVAFDSVADVAPVEVQAWALDLLDLVGIAPGRALVGGRLMWPSSRSVSIHVAHAPTGLRTVARRYCSRSSYGRGYYG